MVLVTDAIERLQFLQSETTYFIDDGVDQLAPWWVREVERGVVARVVEHLVYEEASVLLKSHIDQMLRSWAAGGHDTGAYAHCQRRHPPLPPTVRNC